ncbi:LabA-like protein [Metarhizium robertsii]|uniref:LabA-like protein n=2 Tax=Metarhizium robertsii TaxID=568076 RepID=A0A0A1V7G3_9HYPO|nr:LabA-like protein [Metarhizium robertsii]
MSNLQGILPIENNYHVPSKTPEQESENYGNKPQGLTPKLGDFQKLYETQPLAVPVHTGMVASYSSAGTDAKVNKVIDCNDLAQQPFTDQVAKLGDFQRLQIHLHGRHPVPGNSTLRTRQQLSAVGFKTKPASLSIGDNAQKCHGKEKCDATIVPQNSQSRPSCSCSCNEHHDPQDTEGTPFHHLVCVAQATDGLLPNDSCLASGLERNARAQFGLLSATFHNRRREQSQNTGILFPGYNDLRCPILSTARTCNRTANTARILSYKIGNEGPVTSILGVKSTPDQQHESLSLKLVPLRAADTILAIQDDQIAGNGVHIFLDMSNINISFQCALRGKFSIKEHARFVPLPQLNLQFLTEILVRDRKIMTLNAGCSVLPHRQEPRFVQELRDLGYRVDLRERKRENHDFKAGEASSSEEFVFSRNGGRYVEELVDETLQTRIAESVMEFFKDQGTLVIATGDARPAKYSDGFFAYAERALRMGWNVEVVSWRASLSSHWNRPNWVEQWSGRFRVIELDDYIDHLLV